MKVFVLNYGWNYETSYTLGSYSSIESAQAAFDAWAAAELEKHRICCDWASIIPTILDGTAAEPGADEIALNVPTRKSF